MTSLIGLTVCVRLWRVDALIELSLSVKYNVDSAEEAMSRCKTVRSIFKTDCLSLSLLSFLTSYKLSNVNALFFLMRS